MFISRNRCFSFACLKMRVLTIFMHTTIIYQNKNSFMERIYEMSEGIMEISDGSFDSEVIQSEKPVLVDFWAPWCGPCKAIGPIIEELAGEFSDKIKFAKCNVDDNPVSPGKFGIKAIPTLIFFKQGKVVDQITGMVAKSKLQQTINSIL
jgi:thioredoxin 1